MWEYGAARQILTAMTLWKAFGPSFCTNAVALVQKARTSSFHGGHVCSNQARGSSHYVGRPSCLLLTDIFLIFKGFWALRAQNPLKIKKNSDRRSRTCLRYEEWRPAAFILHTFVVFCIFELLRSSNIQKSQDLMSFAHQIFLAD